MTFTIRYFVRTYWKYYFWGILFLLATNLMAASIPMIIKQVIDDLQIGKPEEAGGLLLWIGVIIVVMFVIRVLSRFFLIGVGRKIEFETRMAMFQHLLSMPRSYYDVQQTGDLMSRLTNDLSALRMFMGGGVMLMVNVIFAYCTILPLMAMLSWRLTLFAFLLYPVVIGMMRSLSMRVKLLSHEVQDRLGELTAVGQENFSGISIIQSYAKEPEESRRFWDASDAYFKTNIKMVQARALLYVLIAMISGVSVLVVMGEGGREVILKELSLSGLMAFMLYLERLSWPTVSFGWILSTFQQGLAAKERINRIFDAKPHITDQDADPTLVTLPAGPIEIRDLSFRYENPYDTANAQDEAPWVLKNISFTVNPGDLVAIVGPIGAGKTTLLNLMIRLYSPPAETILIDEIPLERYPLTVLREGMTLMPQNAFLFSASIRENIAYINPDLPFESVSEMAELARIHPEILGFPKGYDTMVGERGVTLSGGQRQRSTLARTLLVTPQILLMDDPFSNVDTETEEAIIAGLQERHLRHRKTTVFTSQRFSLVRQADKIVVLNANGEMDAIGTHDELIERSALYRSLTRTEQQEEVSA
jgi:ATP-binding cassette, subfamily B, multidrug efflux pump